MTGACCQSKDYYGDVLRDVFVVNVNDSHTTNITGKLQPGGFHNVDWSPDGKYFTLVSVLSNNGDWAYNLYIANADGSELRKLPDGPFQYNISPESWSPDGKQLAFLTATGIAIINADGSGLLNYDFEQHSGERNVFWLGDNRHLVFTDASNNYYKIRTDFTGLEKLTFDTENEKLVYLFQISKARTIYYTESNKVWRTASPQSRDMFYYNNFREKVLSPNGQWIAYVASKYGVADVQIRVISTKTYESYFVFDKDGIHLEWSPDSKQLVFNRGVSDERTGLTYQGLFTVNLDGTGFHQIGDASMGEVSDSAIQP